ncbi:hypothetical protein KDW_52770 [Dictyobacter vulcani]|uniref:Uncharacterized protein n=1 Tax=Dictyobacter vulcani TaxID=2607529 RepID=A0A5J4KT94_9CHLR|nr:hypothetical protein [Dictyobacter vulcani]GER91115.1 hypothetical protein KDW_52770 [Dictyobacter vulcani]
MKLAQMKEIADAILYEGYLLYPYRRSAIKNRQRWTFGVVYPQAYSLARGGQEPWTMRTECLFRGTPHQTQLTVMVRFLHLLQNNVVHVDKPAAIAHDGLIVPRQMHEEWEEGVTREIILPDLTLRRVLTQPIEQVISFPGRYVVQSLSNGSIRSSWREQQDILGLVKISASNVQADIYKLVVSIENLTPQAGIDMQQREAVLLNSFISTHTILQLQQGTFFSSLDPPDELSEVARRCQNCHTWPVLIGDEGELQTMLSSPIILYDYPKIAPESVGSFFDGTEIDEMLTLRMLTLSDDEKEELRHGDERAREILERTESLSVEQLMKLHGVVRRDDERQSVDERGNRQ